MESSRYRKKLTLTAKLAEIEELRQAVVAQREALEQWDERSVRSEESTYSRSSTTHGRSRSQKGGNIPSQVSFKTFRPPNSPSNQHDTLRDSKNSIRRLTDPLLPKTAEEGIDAGIIQRSPRAGGGTEIGVIEVKEGSDIGTIQRSPRMLDDAIAAARSLPLLLPSPPFQVLSPNANINSTNIFHAPFDESPRADMLNEGPPPFEKRGSLEEDLQLLDTKVDSPVENISMADSKEGSLMIAVLGPILSDAEIAMRGREKFLESESKIIQQQLHHIKRFDGYFVALKEDERTRNTEDKARELERKRRLLSKEEGIRTGPGRPETTDIYDFYATRIQALIRGFVKRRLLVFHKENMSTFVTSIQKIVRGGLARFFMAKYRADLSAACTIQRVYRGWHTRFTSAHFFQDKEISEAAKLIQKIVRGFQAKYRVTKKRILDQASNSALTAVDPKNLYISDVKELGLRIQIGIEGDAQSSSLSTALSAVPDVRTSYSRSQTFKSGSETETKTEFFINNDIDSGYPPDEVLFLLRLVVMVIQGPSPEPPLEMTDYSLSGKRSFEGVEGRNLSWPQALKVLNRSEKFVRLVLLVAHGPVSKPPRLVHIPSEAILLYNAQLMNPRWCLNTFQSMGKGTRLCVQLFRFIGGLIDIAAKQQPFTDFLPASFPDWLPKLFELQRVVRFCHCEIMCNTRCMVVINEFVQSLQTNEDQLLIAILVNSSNDLNQQILETNKNLKIVLNNEECLRTEQSSSEEYALTSMSLKLGQLENDLKMTSDEYKRLHNHRSQIPKAEEGEDKTSVGKAIADIRHTLLLKNIYVEEFTNQLKLAEITKGLNKKHMRDLHRLPADGQLTATTAGEARGLHAIASAKKLVLLQSTGVFDPSYLPTELMSVYHALESSEQRLEEQAEKFLQDMDIVRMRYEEMRATVLSNIEAADLMNKEYNLPSEAELQQERVEDEEEARREKARLTQYVPDHLLQPIIPNSRLNPMVICISKDVPAFSQRKLLEELTRLLPGLFVTLEVDAPYGIDRASMQAVLTAGSSIIMSVDAGLTRLSRVNFITRLELVVQSLYPTPGVVLALGDEGNRGGYDGDHLYGVHVHHLDVMRDGDVKRALENKARGINQMICDSKVYRRMQALSTEIWPPNSELAVVLEALYILQTCPDDDCFINRNVSTDISAITWKLTSQLLSEPYQLVALLKSLSRGSYTLARVENLLDYTHRRDWPVQGGEMRHGDKVLDIIASYVEDWIVCERGTLDRGGPPLPMVTKSAMKIFQAVVWVGDSPVHNSENKEVIDVTGKTDYGWRIPAARLARATLQVYIQTCMHV